MTIIYESLDFPYWLPKLGLRKGNSNILSLGQYNIIYYYGLIIRHNACAYIRSIHPYVGHIVKSLLIKEVNKDHGGRMPLY